MGNKEIPQEAIGLKQRKQAAIDALTRLATAHAQALPGQPFSPSAHANQIGYSPSRAKLFYDIVQGLNPDLPPTPRQKPPENQE